jgi:hypothetical protein
MTAIILNKPREPIRVVTATDLARDGLNNLALLWNVSNVQAEEEYTVGKHGYIVRVYTDGGKSPVRRIF